MKKLLLIAFAVIPFSFVSNAQTTENSNPTKEEKIAMKTKKTQELNDAIKELGLTDDQANQVKDVLKDAAKRNSELKKDTTITNKEAKKEDINSEKNDKLKQIMGADKYRQWNAIRKSQKEQNSSAATPSSANSSKDDN